MGIEFPDAVLLIGVLLGTTAALSGWLHGTVLSTSVLSLLAGIVLAATGVISVSPGEELVVVVVELALLLTLFSDGLVAERELLRIHWRPPVRALVVAMPLTLILLALFGELLFPISWSEAFLLGAVLAPTDPVVTSSVVTSERVPRLIRHTLNLESGLNDGLALPLVLFFLVLASPGGDAAAEAVSLLGEVVAGASIGVALALAAGWLLGHLPGGGIRPHYEGVYALGVALAAFGLAEVTYGNGLIAAFVCGIGFAVARSELPAAFLHFNENVSAAFQVITFVIFGALIVVTGWHGSVWRLVLFIAFALFVARPAAVWVSFAGIDLPRSQRLFVAWFGPKGVASMLFALFVLNSHESHRTLIFDLASFVVISSILAHGLTDTVGARWIESRIARPGRGEQQAGRPARRRQGWVPRRIASAAHRRER
ncbi:MAG TPA: cation:proton antiporter [Gaiellaceae bacterium]|nr:cation:proton antiporter [Gaiellaceae bacterium]